MEKMLFQGDLLCIPANIQGWEEFTKLNNIKDKEIVSMRRGVDAALIGANNCNFHIENKLPPCILLFYLDVLGFDRIYTGVFTSSKNALNIKTEHPIFGKVNVIINLSTAFRKGFVLTKVKDNARGK